MTRRPPVALVAALTVVVALGGCASDNEIGSSSGGSYIAGDGTVTEFPRDERTGPIEFTGSTDEGRTFTSSDHRGTPVVINFWYASCPPCRTEAPWLQQLAEQYEGRVQFVGVNLRDSAETSRAFARRFEVDYPSIVDVDGSVVGRFAGAVSPAAVPTTIVLDADGRPASRVLGLIDQSVLRELIDTALEEGDR